MEIPDWQCSATHCSFCGKHKDAVEVLVIGLNGIGICDECALLCNKRIKEHRALKLYGGSYETKSNSYNSI